MDILTPHIGLIFWQTIILVTAYIILRKFAWKPILAYIEEQEKKQAQALKEESVARKKAQRIQIMSDNLLEKAQAKKEQILRKAQAAKAALIAEAKIQREEEYTAMLTKAREDIQKEKKVALQTFTKNQAGVLVVKVAKEILKRELEHKHVQQAVLSKLLEEANIEKAQ